MAETLAFCVVALVAVEVVKKALTKKEPSSRKGTPAAGGTSRQTASASTQASLQLEQTNASSITAPVPCQTGGDAPTEASATLQTTAAPAKVSTPTAAHSRVAPRRPRVDPFIAAALVLVTLPVLLHRRGVAAFQILGSVVSATCAAVVLSERSAGATRQLHAPTTIVRGGKAFTVTEPESDVPLDLVAVRVPPPPPLPVK